MSKPLGESVFLDANADPIRIIIADDHALVRGGIALLIKLLDPNAEVIECNSYEKTIEALGETEEVDVVLLDLKMPGMHGMEEISNICRTWPDVPVIVVTVRDDSAAVHSAIRAGASGFIPKSSTPDVTMSAIRLVLAGGIYLPPAALHLGEEEFLSDLKPDGAIDSGPNTDAANNLTKRQQEVLSLMAEGKSNKEIAQSLGLTPGTIKMHISRIFKVLGVKNRTEAVTKFAF